MVKWWGLVLSVGNPGSYSQEGFDRYPQMNLSRGVFENVYQRYSRISDGIQLDWCKLVKHLSQFQPNSTKGKVYLQIVFLTHTRNSFMCHRAYIHSSTKKLVCQFQRWISSISSIEE